MIEVGIGAGVAKTKSTRPLCIALGDRMPIKVRRYGIIRTQQDRPCTKGPYCAHMAFVRAGLLAALCLYRSARSQLAGQRHVPMART